jgi:hypothetical protein
MLPKIEQFMRHENNNTNPHLFVDFLIRLVTSLAVRIERDMLKDRKSEAVKEGH